MPPELNSPDIFPPFSIKTGDDTLYGQGGNDTLYG
jgi:hypothetical protein